MPTPKLTNEIIIAAILGFEEQKRQIDTKIAELRAVLTGGPTEPVALPEAPTTKKRRKMSAAGRRAIAEAQRKRWAASRKAAEPSGPAATPKPKRKLSRAGRAAIVAATKKRWDAVRAAKAQLEKAAAKKPATKKAAKKAPVKKAAKKAAVPVKKAVTKKTAPAAAPSVTETGAQ
jgi:DNA polymerase III gamma/tau subunit